MVLEANQTLFEQTKFTGHWQPYRNVLLQYDSPALVMQHPRPTHRQSWREFKNLLEMELARPESGRDVDWIHIPVAWIISLRNYFHAAEEYDLEREVLEMQRSFLGYRNQEWGLNYLDNLVLTGRLGKAQLWMDQFQQEFSGTFEVHMGQGLLRTAQGRLQEGLEFFNQAARLDPYSFRVHLELAGTLRKLQKEPEARSAIMKARDRIGNVRQLMAYRKALRQFPG